MRRIAFVDDDAGVRVDKRGDELAEGLAIFLAKGGAHTLAVVGEDDEVVGAGGVCRGAFEGGGDAIESSEDFEGVRTIDTGMVGDFVVSEEGGVDGGDATIDIGDEHEETGFLHKGGGGGADEGVFETAVDAGLVVAADLLAG
jgi:hypothetical protein